MPGSAVASENSEPAFLRGEVTGESLGFRRREGGEGAVRRALRELREPFALCFQFLAANHPVAVTDRRHEGMTEVRLPKEVFPVHGGQLA